MAGCATKQLEKTMIRSASRHELGNAAVVNTPKFLTTAVLTSSRPKPLICICKTKINEVNLQMEIPPTI